MRIGQALIGLVGLLDTAAGAALLLKPECPHHRFETADLLFTKQIGLSVVAQAWDRERRPLSSRSSSGPLCGPRKSPPRMRIDPPILHGVSQGTAGVGPSPHVDTSGFPWLPSKG